MSGFVTATHCLRPTTAMQFATALSHKIDVDAAARDLVDEVRARLGPAPISLACLFFSEAYSEKVQQLSGALMKLMRPKLLLGCSGEGVIAGREELETGPAVALWVAVLPDVELEPFRLSFSSELDQFHMSAWPRTEMAQPSVLLLADPFTTPVQEMLDLFEERYPGVKAIGGLAGGGREAGMNRLVVNDQVFGDGLVGVQLSGAVDVRSIISQGCRLIGERFVVTKATHNLIHELGGVPALERLHALVESLEDEDRQQAQRGLHLGIVMDEHRNRFGQGDFLSRNLLGADQATGAVAVGEIVQEGQTVQFQLRDAGSASDELHTLLAQDREQYPCPPLGALMFSCCGRGRGLFGRSNHDAEATATQLGSIPMAGFFAQGEIGPVGRKNFLHGYTASLALFAERYSA